MLRSLSLQTSNHILFGAWTKHVNDIILQRYYRKFNQYCELLRDWLSKWPSISQYNGYCPLHTTGYRGQPCVRYSAFGESGHYNGILMTDLQARTLFELLEGGKRFEYNQNSFAAWHDDGLSADDTFKIAKKVHVTTSGKQRVQAMSSVLTLLAQCGKIVASIWKMGMSHEVNTNILEGIKIAREYVDAPALKLLQTDNPKGEEKPYYDMFPSLRQGTTKSTSLPAIKIPEQDIMVFEKSNPAENFFFSVIDHFPNNQDMYYGLDTEFEVALSQQLPVLSLSFSRQLNDGSTNTTTLPRVVVLHLHKMGRRFPSSLKRLLQQENMIPIGRQIGGDCDKLKEQYGINIARRVELRNLCKIDRPDLAQVSGGLKLDGRVS